MLQPGNLLFKILTANLFWILFHRFDHASYLFFNLTDISKIMIVRKNDFQIIKTEKALKYYIWELSFLRKQTILWLNYLTTSRTLIDRWCFGCSLGQLDSEKQQVLLGLLKWKFCLKVIFRFWHFQQRRLSCKNKALKHKTVFRLGWS